MPSVWTFLGFFWFCLGFNWCLISVYTHSFSNILDTYLGNYFKYKYVKELRCPQHLGKYDICTASYRKWTFRLKFASRTGISISND